MSVIARIRKTDARIAMPLMDRGVRSSWEGLRPRAAAGGRVAGTLGDEELPARDEAVRRGVFGVPPGRRVVATVAAPLRLKRISRTRSTPSVNTKRLWFGIRTTLCTVANVPTVCISSGFGES